MNPRRSHFLIFHILHLYIIPNVDVLHISSRYYLPITRNQYRWIWFMIYNNLQSQAEGTNFWQELPRSSILKLFNKFPYIVIYYISFFLVNFYFWADAIDVKFAVWRGRDWKIYFFIERMSSRSVLFAETKCISFFHSAAMYSRNIRVFNIWFIRRERWNFVISSYISRRCDNLIHFKIYATMRILDISI